MTNPAFSAYVYSIPAEISRSDPLYCSLCRNSKNARQTDVFAEILPCNPGFPKRKPAL